MRSPVNNFPSFLRSNSGMKKHLLSNTSSWEETYSERTHQQDFIEDGKLVHTTKRAEINNEGKMELVFDLYVSFTLDSQGNVIRESIYYLPKKNIEITIVMRTLRCVREGQTEFNKCTCNLFTVFGHLPRCLAFWPSGQWAERRESIAGSWQGRKHCVKSPVLPISNK